MGWATGKHALITGGGSGIGAAAARMLAAEGARVSLLGRRREPLEAVASEVGGRAYPADMTDREAMAKAFDAARGDSGAFDFVVLNAGIGDSAPFLKTKRETFDAIIATNLTAVFDGAQLALPDLLVGDGEGKRLIVVASVAGLKGGAYAAPYVASKHGVVGLVRSLALEFAKTRPDDQRDLPVVRRHPDGRRQRGAHIASDQPRPRRVARCAGRAQRQRPPDQRRGGRRVDPQPVPSAQRIDQRCLRCHRRRHQRMSFDPASFAPTHFRWAFADGVATITLDRPDKKNPLTFDSYAELRDTFRSLWSRPRCAAWSSPAQAAISARAATFTRSSAR